MPACALCDFTARSVSGLAKHRWSKHRADEVPGKNKEALEQTLACLVDAGRVEEVDAAAVQALRSMAAALDLNPFNDRMWREYRESLREVMADGGNDDGLADLLERLSAPARDS